jgi:murein DD-endopeptidase MepM/ murein hydrolase activator NlpD
MRRGVRLLVFGVVAAALAPAFARAGGTGTTGTTTTTAAPAYSRLAPSYLPAGCVGAGAAAIAEPGRSVLALGTPASARGPSAYPAKAPIVAFDASTASGSACGGTSVGLQSVSLFGGVVTASSVDATAGRGTVTGLQVDGTAIDPAAGQIVPVQDWGQLSLGPGIGRLTAPLVLNLLRAHDSLPAGTAVVVAFAAAPRPVDKPRASHHASGTTRSSRQHPATTTAQRRAQPAPAKKKPRHKKRHTPQPLTVTPALGFEPSHYVFPVDGGASYIDTYGANRSDIYDGWHHGDDLFAPLGTPVVAAANGTLSLVGWNRVGGWRLWLTDAAGNSFYYAHLAGYARWILDHPRVRAGQVVGFLGRTGDAFTTTPHLHFEIHPHQLLQLGYDGAVDPTLYLHKWRVVHVPADEMPQPAKLKAPVGTPTEEASVVWHELLVARHLLPVATVGIARRPFPPPMTVDAAGASPVQVATVRPTAAHVAPTSNDVLWMVGAILVAAGLAVSGGAFTVLRRRRVAGESSS